MFSLSQVDILLGVNTPEAVKPLEIVSGQWNEPYAVRSALGWTVNGPSSMDLKFKKKLCNATKVDTRIQAMLEKLYNEEFLDGKDSEAKSMSVNDQRFMRKVESTVRKEGSHYVISLPFKEDGVLVPNNRKMAEDRAESLKRKMKKNLTFNQHYVKAMEELIEKGYVQRVENEDQESWLIPHHGVYHPRKPNKIRIVFDCSAKYSGFSLNEQLLSGPDLANTLLGVLVRSRLQQVAFMADVEAMFHQVKVPKEDRKFLRFLWWPSGNVDEKMQLFEFTVHPFGAISSPSCANYALRRTALDNMGSFGQNVVDAVLHNFYVEDCIDGEKNDSLILPKMMDLKQLLSCGGFNLTKFICSSKDVMRRIPVDDRAKCVQSLDLDGQKLPSEKVLGMEWCTDRDCFVFNISLQKRPANRRSLLSIVSSVFDPMGFLGPIILPAKILLQELCRKKLTWDEPIPVEFENNFRIWMDDLSKLKSIEIPRCVMPNAEVRRTELHHFSDASGHGYGIVSYLRTIGDFGCHCSLLFAKARCAPLKTMTIPRLELTAATLSVRVDQMLRRELTVSVDQSYFWTDSTTVLKYINNEARRFHVFVANRVQRIRDGSDVQQWRYVNTKENPADYVSRGLKVSDFVAKKDWICGPQFLWRNEHHWINPHNISELDQADVEVKTMAIKVDEEKPFLSSLIQSKSSWVKLLRSVAWLLIATRRLKGSIRGEKHIDVDDMMEAEKLILAEVQRQYFGKERVTLTKYRTCGRQCKIKNLDPFIEDDLIRVGGRLRRAKIPYDAKHPVLVPKESHVAKLLIRHCHFQVGHMGRETVLSKLRGKYWIVNGTSLVARELKSCVQCRKRMAKPMQQKMADLPLDRVEGDVPPFTNVGVDYFGPFWVKKERGQEKRYGCIFTCLNVRAIHIEVAESLSTDSFINALRRFISRRGQVKLMRSDNGTNFRGAYRELKDEIKKMNRSGLKEFASLKGITWLFNPPGASHHGGVWERMIRTIRNVFGSLLGEQKMTDEQLRTLMCEVESIVNGRPLTVNSSDPNDYAPLTPNDLLIQKRVTIFPPGLFGSGLSYAARRWRQVQYMTELFWKRWRKEYLATLHSRQKWISEKPNVNAGDLVILVDENSPRNIWKLGVVERANKDDRGIVRSARIKANGSTIERPITKLCLLKCVEDLEAN